MAETVRVAVGEIPPQEGERFNGLYLQVGETRVRLSLVDITNLGQKAEDAARRIVSWSEQSPIKDVIFECEATPI